MKQPDFLPSGLRRSFENAGHPISIKKFYILLAAATFFFIITAQIFWSAIHGDGAVYAWIIRQISEHGILSSQLPNWTPTQVFAEHPYLFFYFSSLFTKFLGFSDLVLKIPNFIIAALSIFIVYKICNLRAKEQSRSHYIGLIASYALVFNSAYMLQISQPSLDPLAQLLALISVVLFIFYRRSFLAGLFIGLAFLTKGLEMLPNLTALLVFTCYLERKNSKELFKNIALQVSGLLIPIALWMGTDFLFWGGQWLTTYWNRQFTSRFFKKENMQTVFSFGILLTFLKVYLIEMIILVIGLVKSKRWARKEDPLFIYFCCYLFFNVLAFLIIKKDSSQHLTGVSMLGSVFVGEYVWEAWGRVNWKYFRAVPVFLFILSFAYWSWYVMGSKQNPDIWTSIRNESRSIASQDNKIQIVIKGSAEESYGLFHTAQWYFHPHKVYLQSEANQLLVNQEVFVLGGSAEDGRLKKTNMIYQAGAL